MRFSTADWCLRRWSRRCLGIVALPIILSACGVSGSGSPPGVIAKHSEHQQGVSDTITLITVVSRRNGTGAHSALLIDADERILFDPAGSFQSVAGSVQGDLHIGITEEVLMAYLGYHARDGFDVLLQETPVTRDQALEAAALAQSRGPVPQSQCAWAITRLLAEVDGFERVGLSVFPKGASRRFAQVTRADTVRVHEGSFQTGMSGSQAFSLAQVPR